MALLSTITLTTVAPVIASADEYEARIQERNDQINQIASEQAQAQAQVTEIQAQINENRASIAELESETKVLEEESDALTKEVDALNERIIERSERLDDQARSAQINQANSSYLEIILNSESLVDAINRIQAITRMMAANNTLLTQQHEDRATVLAKQEENAVKIATVWYNQRELEAKEESLVVREAELTAAQLALDVTRAETEAERDSLMVQQAEAVVAAERAAQEEAERVAAVAAQRATAEREARESEAVAVAQEQARQAVAPEAATPAPEAATPAPEAPATPPISRPAAGRWRADAGTYPFGQCTWWVKNHFGSRVGDFWGNGGQWAASAAADGLVVTSVPHAQSVAVFPPGVAGASGLGHVAVAESVNPDGTVNISEMNWMGIPGVVNRRTVPAAGVLFILV